MVQLDLTLDASITRSEFYKVVRMVQETDAEYFSRSNLFTPEQAADFIRSKVADIAHEVFGVIFLDTKNRPTGWAIVGNGGLSDCQVHLRNVFLPALVSGAGSIIVFHNHPSGDPQPSKADLHVTEQIIKAGRLLGVVVVDHIVIGGCSDEFVSLQAAGQMPSPKNL